MKRLLLFGMGGLVLVALLALASFAAAASPQAAATLKPPASNHTAHDSMESARASSATDPGPMTSRIMIFNLATATATVSITLINPDGSTAYTYPNFTVAAKGTVHKKLPNTLPSPFTGSAVVSSDQNVQAYVTNDNSSDTARDTYDGTDAPNTILTLPLVRHLASGTQRSLIAVQNTSSTAGQVTLQLYNPDGTLFGSPSSLTVQPSASGYFNTDTLVGSGTFTGTARITADPGLSMATAEQSEYYLDTASFRGLNASDADKILYLPSLRLKYNASGAMVAWSEIYVRNNGSAPTNITAQFYTKAGVLRLTVTRNTVPANGQAQFLINTAEFDGLTGSNTKWQGWAKITSGSGQPSDQPIVLYGLTALSSGNRLMGIEGIPLNRVGTKFACGDTFHMSSSSEYSKIAIVNIGSSSANVTIKLRDPSTGSQVASNTYAVNANQQLSPSLSDPAFNGAGSDFEGVALVNSDSSQIVVSTYTQAESNAMTSYTCDPLH
jgi:hypothetical protein